MILPLTTMTEEVHNKSPLVVYLPEGSGKGRESAAKPNSSLDQKHLLFVKVHGEIDESLATIIYRSISLMCIIENLMDIPSIKKLWYIPT